MTGKKNYILRSLGYLSLPEAFKKKFGINSKKKERLQIFPEPKKVTLNFGEETTTITYIWNEEDLKKYIDKVNGNE